ncbi:MAG: glycosyltransferase [Gammaproteobacteria bacterium]|nr:glycosyltransferase [Gammaproteobacteria bacterium]
MIGTLLAFAALAAWIYLFALHGRFWRSAPELLPAVPDELPDVDVLVPARDERETIARAIGSLLAQDYRGRFRVILIDDQSSDGTAEAAGESPGLSVIRGQPKPDGWSGKLWALAQGVEASRAPVLLFTDADIVHDPRHLSTLVARLLKPRTAMVSELVRLNCESDAERLLVPAFVYFFQMLYPFARVNDPRSRLAAASGGVVLLRREALEAAGGIAAIRETLIDDVALARAIKPFGAIYLGHSGLATSVREYQGFAQIWRMITRTAFTQLRHSALLLAATIAGMALIWFVPLWQVLLGQGGGFVAGLAAFCLSTITFLPTLNRYGRSHWLAFTLPLVAAFYLAATMGSAVDAWFGRGARWKSRAYRKGA